MGLDVNNVLSEKLDGGWAKPKGSESLTCSRKSKRARRGGGVGAPGKGVGRSQRRRPCSELERFTHSGRDLGFSADAVGHE